MMGRQKGGQDKLFYSFNLDDHVPHHLLRGIDACLDLSGLRRHLAEHYSPTGRPSVDPEYSYGIWQHSTENRLRLLRARFR